MNDDKTRMKGFKGLAKGMSTIDVEEILGTPDCSEKKQMPNDSGFGQQSAMWIKIAPGEPFLEWTYQVKGFDLMIWFSLKKKEGEIALTLSLPRLPDRCP